MKTCPQCSIAFSAPGRQFLCSRACADLWRRTRTTISCQHCDKQFVVFKSETERGRKFCSHECSAKDKECRAFVKCLHCEEWFVVKPARARVAKYCSWWCFRKATTHLTEDEREYTAHVGYRKNRKIVRERDGYACVRCGSTETVQVHHKIPYRVSKDHSIDNLECLCLKCHVAADREYRLAVAA